MNFSEDLERVLWHEFGHFFVGILEIEFDKNYTIDDFWVSYHHKSTSIQKWGGGVKMIPSIKFNILVEDLDKTAFAMLGFISGCVFETFFRNEILKSNIVFEDCFGIKPNCAGYSDFMCFFSTGSEFRKKYGRQQEFINFSEIELFEIYYDEIISNIDFVDEIKKFIIIKRNEILEDFDKSEHKEQFSYYFTNEQLEILKNVVMEIMTNTKFKETILEIKRNIMSKMEINPSF